MERNVLPTQLLYVDGRLKPAMRESPKRVDPQSEQANARLEADWDAFLLSEPGTALLADALRQGRVIGEESELIAVGTQVENIDVLYAEVDGREFVRFVILENKLLRNREAHRQVLAQTFDYALGLGDSYGSPAALASLFEGIARLEGHEQLALQSILRRDFLLVIAGDGISERLERLASAFAAREAPLDLCELALVSLGLYSVPGADEQFIVIPTVVSAVQRRERELTLVVDVKVQRDGEVVNTTAHVEHRGTPSSTGSLATPEMAEFLGNCRDMIKARIPRLAQYEVTKAPKKQLTVSTTGDCGWASFDIRFGNWEREVLAPLNVGVSATLDTAPRDALHEQLQGLKRDGKLLEGTIISASGKRSLTAAVEIAWKVGDPLNVALAEQCVELLAKFVDATADLLERHL